MGALNRAHMLAAGVLQNFLEPLTYRAGGHGTVPFYRRGEHPT